MGRRADPRNGETPTPQPSPASPRLGVRSPRWTPPVAPRGASGSCPCRSSPGPRSPSSSSRFWIDAGGDLGAFDRLFHPNPESARQAIGNTAEVVSAVLGIAITVVAIVVELASNRYTHRVTELFVGEPVNFAVMGFFVITALQAILVAVVFDHQELPTDFIPYTGILVALAMLAFCLLIVLPYFAFVLEFLNPISIVDRIARTR
ncbi:MAG: DUF2254 domain-containing protein [Sandaracinus sp.]|nr:DUF2254 domain-containing protein [Sandaracinus sp.]